MSGILVAVFATTLLAFTVKGALGFGPALFVVGFLSPVIGIKEAVVLSSFTDLFSGIGVMYLNRKFAPPIADWVFPACLMTISAAVSALLFAQLSSDIISLGIAAMLLISGAWLMLGRPSLSAWNSQTTDPRKEIRSFGYVCFFSGAMAGLTGVGGPFVAVYLASLHNKERFYGLITPVLLVSAAVRFGIYLLTGQVSNPLPQAALSALPALAIGLTLGFRIKSLLPERLFWLFSGMILLGIALRLIIKI